MAETKTDAAQEGLKLPTTPETPLVDAAALQIATPEEYD